MKKLSFILLIFVFAIAACKKDSTSPTTTTTAEQKCYPTSEKQNDTLSVTLEYNGDNKIVKVSEYMKGVIVATNSYSYSGSTITWINKQDTTILTSVYTIDGNGRAISKSYTSNIGSGGTTTFTYDANGYLVKQYDLQTYSYTVAGTTYTNRDTMETTYVINNGNRISEIAKLNQDAPSTTSYTFSDKMDKVAFGYGDLPLNNGKPNKNLELKRTDSNGDVTENTYELDAKGYVTKNTQKFTHSGVTTTKVLTDFYNCK